MAALPLEQLLREAIQHQQAGRIAEAESRYQQVLSVVPTQPDALHLLGLLAHEKGDSGRAVELIQEAIKHRPEIGEFHLNLGNILNATGKPAEAIVAYQRAVALKPTLAVAWSNLAVPLLTLGRIEESRLACVRAVELAPGSAEALVGLGNALLKLNRCEEAADTFRRAITLRPRYMNASDGLARSLQRLGRHDDAIDVYRNAVRNNMDSAEAWRSFAGSLRTSGRHDEAVSALRQAKDLDPSSGATWNQLGIALREAGFLQEALASFERAIELGYDLAWSYSNRGGVLSECGEATAAVQSFRRALEADPSRHQTYSNLLLTLHYSPDAGPREIFEEHLEWDRRYAEPLKKEWRPHGNAPDPDRALQIGYVSGDFRFHPVAALAEPFLTAHDRTQFSVFCYSTSDHSDDVTTRLQGLGHTWRNAAALSDESLSAMVVEDGIDILVDLAGHTPGNRLLVFARKPAPVQVTGWGYPDTTGVRAIDYCFTDAHADPAGVGDHLHVEELVRLPNTVLCYQPWTFTPVSILPARNRGYITFGSMNNLSKVHTAVLDTWADILSRVPDSRLALLVSSSGSETKEIEARFHARGIERSRLRFIGRRPFAEYMQEFNEIDISLDSFPYNGSVTTLNSLWMGVPVVALAGTTHVSRVGLSILNNLKMPEWVAPDVSEYISISERWAHQIDELALVRSELRERMRSSPLMDSTAFTRGLESSYRDMWRRWCASSSRH
jgi:protein O-GlcNAc transferase